MRKCPSSKLLIHSLEVVKYFIFIHIPEWHVLDKTVDVTATQVRVLVALHVALELQMLILLNEVGEVCRLEERADAG